MNFVFHNGNDHKGMPKSLINLFLSYASKMFIRCILKILVILIMEEDGPTLMFAKMRQCLLASSTLKLDLLTSFMDLFTPIKTSCCVKTILARRM